MEEPRWETIGAGRGDAVLAVNFFGAGTGTGWADQRAAADWLLVEDHSHDPFSPWAVGSNADFAFSSLRKTLPVPDGGSSGRRASPIFHHSHVGRRTAASRSSRPCS